MGDRSHYMHGHRGGRDRDRNKDRDRARHSSSSYGHEHDREHHLNHEWGRPQHSLSQRSRTNNSSGDWRSNNPNSSNRHRSDSSSRRSPAWERELSHERGPSASTGQFTRRDDDQEFSRQTGIKPDVLQLMGRLREYIPYLNKRLREIHTQGRERELEEDIEEISWMMEVITDVNADENVGVKTMERVHERVLEMVRKNPIRSAFPANELTDEDDDLNDEGEEAPRSPSPPPPQPQFEPAVLSNPRVIPMERSTLVTDWNYRPTLETRVFEYGHGQESNKSNPTSFEEWERDSQEDRESPVKSIRRPQQEQQEDWTASFRRETHPSRLEKSSQDMDMRFSDTQSSLEWDTNSSHRQTSNLGQWDRDMRGEAGLNSNLRRYDSHSAIDSPPLHGLNPPNPRGLASRNPSISAMNSVPLPDINLMNTGSSLSASMNTLNAGMIPINHAGNVMPMNHNIPTGSGYGVSYGPNGMQVGQSQVRPAHVFPGHARNVFHQQFNQPMMSVPSLMSMRMSNQNQSQSPNVMMNPSVANYHQQMGPNRQNQNTSFPQRVPNSAVRFPSSQSSSDQFHGSRYNPQLSSDNMISKIKEKASMHFGTTSAVHPRVNTQPNQSSHKHVSASTASTSELSAPESSPTERPSLASNQILADPRLRGRFAKDVYVSQPPKTQTSNNPAAAASRQHSVPNNISANKNAPSDAVSNVNANLPTNIVSRNSHISSANKINIPPVTANQNQNNHLKAIRERVRSKTASNPKPQISKLQELRQSIQLHPLGPKSTQKKRVSFEDALIQPSIEKPPERRATIGTTKSNTTTPPYSSDHSREADMNHRAAMTSDYSRDCTDESLTDNDNLNARGKKIQRHKDLEIVGQNASVLRKVRASKTRKESAKDGKERQRRLSSPNDVGRKGSKASNEDTDQARRPSTSFGFRIPKIKRPDPRPAQLSPGVPEQRDNEGDFHDASYASEVETPHVPPVHLSNKEGTQTQSNEEASVNPEPVETDTLIRDLILRTISKGEIENIANNPDYLTVLITRLKTELTTKLRERPNEVGVVETNETVAERDLTDKSVPVESQEQVASTSSLSNETPARGRPRSVNKKKGAKRRSSLEKLHDALREMKFDSMLPLGPRRGTANRNQQDDAAPQTEPAQLLNAVLEANNQKDSTGETATELGNVPSEKTQIDQHPPTKKGRKRKRKGVISTSPKKRGRKSNALNASTTSPSGKATIVQNESEVTKKGPKKAKAEKKKKKSFKDLPPRANAGMVTRSKIGPRDIVVNKGLTKIKMESDYIAPKKEPEPLDNNFCEDETNELEEADPVPDQIDSPETDIANDMGIEACDLENVSSLFDLKLEELDMPIDDDFEGKELLDDFDGNKDLLDAFDENKELLGGLDGNKELMDEFDDMTKSGENLEDVEKEEDINETSVQQPAVDDTVKIQEIEVRVEAVTVNPPEIEDVVKETKTEVKKKTKRKSKKLKPLPANTFECHLCGFTGKKIIYHYTNNHPDQTNPYTCLSRLTYESLCEVNTSASPQLMEVQFLRLGDDPIWPCLFCVDKFSTIKEYFEHTTVHTGEFRYACPICKIRNPFAKSIVSHFKIHGMDPTAHEIPTVLFETVFPPDGRNMYAYVCRECLYFQLQFENMSAHLQKEKHSVEEVICIKFIAPQEPGTEGTPAFDNSVFLGSAPAEVDKFVPLESMLTWELFLPNGSETTRALSESELNKMHDAIVRNEPMEIDNRNSHFVPAETNEQIRQSVENTMDWLLSNVEFRKNLEEIPIQNLIKDSNYTVKQEEQQGECTTTSEVFLQSIVPKTEVEPDAVVSVDDGGYMQLEILDLDKIKSEADDEEINDFFSDDGFETSSFDDDTDENEDRLNTQNGTNNHHDPNIESGQRNFFDQNKNITEGNPNESPIADTTDKLIDDEEEMECERGSENERKGLPTNLKGVDLYRCGNESCNFTGENSFVFKNHSFMCGYLIDIKQIPCFHCDRRLKSIPTLLEHLKVHGRQRQVCGLCSFRSWLNSELTKHMKLAHKTNSYKIIKYPTEDEPDSYVYPKDVASKLAHPGTLKQNHMHYSPKAQFYPHEIENIPRNCIFTSMIYCALCSYSTKVRSNILRHLELHERADTDGGATLVPCGAPINPVPWLERKELMFDKMTNWAGSSHMNKDGNTVPKEDASKLPQFVLDQFRYVCSLENCKQITVDDSLLRAHMKALHSEVEVYHCPHCQNNENTKEDPRNSVLVDKLGGHLKLHGPRLLKCGNCDYIHTQTRVMEKHVSEKHPEKKPIHYLIRNLDNDGNASNRRTSVDENHKNSTDRWRCAICRTLFSSWDDAKNHCQLMHKVEGQFMCTICNFTEDNIFRISSHVQQHDCVLRKTSSIMIMFFKNEPTQGLESKQDESMIHSIWRRDDVKVRHIRGIYLEEIKDRESPNSAASTTPTKSSKPREIPQSEPQTKLVCPECHRFKTSVPSELIIHLYNELRYQRYSCKSCKVPFVTLDSLMAHVMNDHKEAYDELIYLKLEPVNEDIEKYVRDTVDQQTKAIEAATVTITSTGSEHELPCRHCPAMFTAYHNLKTHVLAKHIAPERFKCKHCTAGFYSEAVLKQHHSKGHPDKLFETILDQEFETMLTSEFWFKNYGIPVDYAKSVGIGKRVDILSTTGVGKTSVSLKPKPRKPISTIGPDKTLKSLPKERDLEKKAKVYRCSHCEKKCFTSRGMRSHWCKIHKNSFLPCRYLEFKGFNRSMEVTDGINLTCCYCMYSASSMLSMKSHHGLKHPGQPFRLKRKQHQSNTGVKGIQKTALCVTDRILRPKPFPTTELCNEGILNDSSENYKLIEDKISYECPHCTSDYISEIEYEKHIHSKHQDDQVEPTLKYLRTVVTSNTPKCRNKIIVPKIPLEHVNGFKQSPMFGCPECDYKSTDREELVKTHLRTHVNSFKCPTCDLGFKNSIEARFHIRHFHCDAYDKSASSPNAFVEYCALQSRVFQIPRHPIKSKLVSNVKINPPTQSTAQIPVIDIGDDDDDVIVLSPPTQDSKLNNKFKQTARKSTGKSPPNNNVITIEKDDESSQTFGDSPGIFSKGYSIEYDEESDFDETYEDPSTYVPGPSNPNVSCSNLVG